MRRSRALLLVPLFAAWLCMSCGEDAPRDVEDAPAVAPVQPASVPTEVPPPVESSTESVVSTATAPTAEPDAPEVVSEKWYERRTNGQHSGWLHVVWTVSEYDGRPTIHDRSENYSVSTRLMSGVSDRFEARSVTDIERTEDGLLLWMETVAEQGGTRSVATQTWTGSGYELVQRVGEGDDTEVRETRTVAADGPLPIDAEAFLGPYVRDETLVTGRRLTFQAPNFLGERLDTVVLEVEGRDLLTLPTGTADCWRIRRTIEGRSGTSHLWLDADGVVRRFVAEASELIHTTARRAQELDSGGAAYSITLYARPELPRCTSFESSEVEVSIEPREQLADPVFPDTPFSRVVDREPGRVRLELVAHDDPAAAPAYPLVLPEDDADLARWLEPTLLLNSDHPRVQAAVATALGDAPVTDSRDAVRRLLRYVFRSLQKVSGPHPQPTAVQILEDGCGDCSEHNVLFVALCRAAGIPARRWSGYAQVGDQWGAHAFAEVWLGRWIGADPTTNELGTSARYIAFGQADDPDSEAGLVSARSTGRLSIRTLRFVEGGEEVVIGTTDALTETFDPHSGLSLGAVPEGWESRLGRGGRASLRRGEVRCSAQVSAGMGDLDADLLREWAMGGSDQEFEFLGHDAAGFRREWRDRVHLRLAVPHRRRAVVVSVSAPLTEEEEALEVLETWLRPTLAETSATPEDSTPAPRDSDESTPSDE